MSHSTKVSTSLFKAFSTLAWVVLALTFSSCFPFQVTGPQNPGQGGLQGNGGGYAGLTSNSLYMRSNGQIVVGLKAQNGNSLVQRLRGDFSVDSTFGADGDLAVPYSEHLLVQSTGNVIVSGTVSCSQPPAGSNWQPNGPNNWIQPIPNQPNAYATYFGGICFQLQRYHSDGSLDTQFGTGGSLNTNIVDGYSEAGGLNLQPQALRLQNDDRILVAGLRGQFPYDNISEVNRYTANGSLDASFGNGGEVTHTFSASSVLADSIAVLADGTIRVLSIGFLQIWSNLDALLANGSKDTAFSANLPATNFDSMIVQPDGKLLLGGYDTNTSTFLISRFDANGAPDLSFGSSGSAATTLNAQNGNAFLALQSDGKIIVAGDSMDITDNILGPSYIGLTRLGTNGTVDQSFGEAGVIRGISANHIESTTDMAVESDGSIVVLYNSSDMSSNPPTSASAQIARISADGQIDQVTDLQ